jgi:hypothetical protein
VVEAIAAPPALAALPAGFRVTLDHRVRFWSEGAVIVGGSPWRIARTDPRAGAFIRELRAHGSAVASSNLERSIARSLLNRGFAYPSPHPARSAAITVVVPAFGRIAALRRCLESLSGHQVLVVDDGSPAAGEVEATASATGVRLVRHNENRGPAAARNTGLRETSGDLVAFLDSDCTPEPGWLAALAGHFDDPLVALVAPRVLPDARGTTLLARHELARSALDMGLHRVQLSSSVGRRLRAPALTSRCGSARTSIWCGG